MSLLELVARVIALIPPPYHLVRYHGVFAPHHAWRAEIVSSWPAVASTATEAFCGEPHAEHPAEPQPQPEERPEERAPKRVRWRGWVAWATLLAKTFGLDVLSCPRCGERMRLVNVVVDRATIAWWLQRSGCQADEPP